ncbi:hypothetical protein BSKO_01427 [Bryopsis sp. KO-2023]|nr:hypothetical protein BSKO_01427 [Bryopsis sp. KO-2023]
MWDCGGSSKYKPYWNSMASDLDGLIIVYDQHESSERDIEKFYTRFAQANNLSKRQCLVASLTIDGAGGYSPGLQGKLKALNHCQINVQTQDGQASAQEAEEHFLDLIQGCLYRRAEES